MPFFMARKDFSRCRDTREEPNHARLLSSFERHRMRTLHLDKIEQSQILWGYRCGYQKNTDRRKLSYFNRLDEIYGAP